MSDRNEYERGPDPEVSEIHDRQGRFLPPPPQAERERAERLAVWNAAAGQRLAGTEDPELEVFPGRVLRQDGSLPGEGGTEDRFGSAWRPGQDVYYRRTAESQDWQPGVFMGWEGTGDSRKARVAPEGGGEAGVVKPEHVTRRPSLDEERREKHQVPLNPYFRSGSPQAGKSWPDLAEPWPDVLLPGKTLLVVSPPQLKRGDPVEYRDPLTGQQRTGAFMGWSSEGEPGSALVTPEVGPPVTVSPPLRVSSWGDRPLSGGEAASLSEQAKAAALGRAREIARGLRHLGLVASVTDEPDPRIVLTTVAALRALRELTEARVPAQAALQRKNFRVTRLAAHAEPGEERRLDCTFTVPAGWSLHHVVRVLGASVEVVLEEEQ